MTTKLSELLNSQSGNNVTVITESRNPLSSDAATLGTMWINETSNKVFVCVDDTVGGVIWVLAGGEEDIIIETRAPNASDLGNLGTLWIDTVTNKFYICTDDTPSATIWDTDTQIDVIEDTIDPESTDDDHPLGTLWINTLTGRLFFCTDNSLGSAIWRPTVEVLDMTVDPTPSDYEYPLGTMWINASTVNQKTYFILVDNTPNMAVWSKNETDVYWVTDPTITGSLIVDCDETVYTYQAYGSISSIDNTSPIEYHWACTGGVLTETTGVSGTEAHVYFETADRASTQYLSCYAEDNLGYVSEAFQYEIQVNDVNPVTGLVLSLPNKIITNEAAFFDVTVGNDGGDHNLTYLWESSDDGTTWDSLKFVDETAKLSEALFTLVGVTYIRCTVTNLGGDVTITSSPIPTIDTVSDFDSTYLDTDLHELENKEYDGTFVSASVASVPTVIFEVDDRVIVNGNQDNITNVNNVFDTQLNMVTDEMVINDDFTSFPTTCTMMGNKIIVAYNDSASGADAVIRVGTFNGDTVVFGDPVIFNGFYSQWITLLPLVDNKVIVAYRDDGNANLGGCRIGTVGGDTITFSAEFVFNSVDTDHIDMCKIDDSRFAIVYSDYGTGNLGTMVIGEVSGSTITFGTQQVYTNSAYYNSVTLVDTDQLVIAYQDDINSNYGTAVVADVTGTNISLGTPVVFNNNGYTNYINVLTIATDQIVITYQDVGTSGFGYAIVGVLAGSNLSFGTPQLFEASNSTYISSSYANNKLFISFKDSLNLGVSTFGTVTGTSISFESDIIFNELSTSFVSAFPLDNKLVIVFKDNGDSDKGKVMVYTPYKQEITFESEIIAGDVEVTRLNTEYVLPIINQEPAQDVFEKVEMRVQTQRNNTFDVYESGGNIIYENYEITPYVVGDRLLIQGDIDVYANITGISRTVLSGTGESVPGDEFIFNNDNTQQTSAALLDGGFIVNAFRDNSSVGSIIMGEVKYDDILYGTKLAFSTNDVDYVSITKVSNDKALVCFQDLSDMTGKCFIAKEVDGELVIGTVFQFNAGQTEYIDVTGLDNDKFVISFQDVGDSNKGKCIIGTVADTIITLGSEIEFSGDNTTYISVTMVDFTKIAISYRDVTGSGNGTVIVGTIVGMGITFGTPFVFYANSATYTDIELIGINKVIVKYTDYTNSNYGATVVGVITGTSIVFGTPTYFNQHETYYSNVVALESDMFMVVYDNYIGNKAYSRVGSVSGNAITFDSAVEINNSTTSHIDTIKVNNYKIVATYSDQGNNYKGTAQIIRRDVNLLRSEISVDETLPSSLATVDLLPYRIEASIGEVQSFDETEYYHTDLDEIYSVLNPDTLLTTATITTSGNYFYSRIKSVNTDEFDKLITRVDIDFWTQP